MVRRLFALIALLRLLRRVAVRMPGGVEWQVWLDIAKNYVAPVSGLIALIIWRIHATLTSTKKEDDAARQAAEAALRAKETALQAEEAALDRKQERFNQSIEVYAEMLVERAERAERKQIEAERALRAEKQARERLELTLRHLARQSGQSETILAQHQVVDAHRTVEQTHEEAATAISEARDLLAQTRRDIAALPERVRAAHEAAHDGEPVASPVDAPTHPPTDPRPTDAERGGPTP